MPLSRRHLLLATGGAALLSAIEPVSKATAQLPHLLPQGDDIAVDHLVIGSGYGGAVAAFRLATAGERVRVLEMGRRWPSPEPGWTTHPAILHPDWRAMWYAHETQMPLSTFLGVNINKEVGYGPGVLDRRKLGEMDVYVGRGVGGGSIVNGGMAPRPRRDVISRQLPGLDVEQFFGTYLPRAEQRLQINSISPAFRESTPWYQFSRTGRQDAEAAGYRVVNVPNNYDFAYMEKEAAGEVPASALAGEVIFGNNYGKRDLTKTYLAQAEATGKVQIDTMTEVLTVRPSAGGFLVETQVRNFDGSIATRPRFLARKVYFGAGSVGTPEILMRSQAAGYLPNLSDAVGGGWSPNGNTMFGRANYLWRPTGNKHSTIPIMGIDRWESNTPCFTEIAPMPAGVDLYLQLYLCIADNPNSGNFHFDDGVLSLDWTRAMSDPSVRNARATFDVINRQQGTTYRSDLFGNREQFSRHFTYHPLGGAVLGKATDNFGRLLGYEGLYVTDGALIPQIVGVNPYLTITALAERLMDDVLARGA